MLSELEKNKNILLLNKHKTVGPWLSSTRQQKSDSVLFSILFIFK